MPRFSTTQAEQMFVDNTAPKKDNRRQSQRYKILAPASIIRKDQDPLMVKVVNLGMGGCKFVSHDKFDIKEFINIVFYVHSREEEWRACTPVNAKVLHIISKDDRNIVNLSFLSSIHAEHGIELVIRDAIFSMN